MVNKRRIKGIAALAAGIMVLAACASSSTLLDEPLMPDARTAVVVFMSDKTSKAQVWDGEKPVGSFKETPGAAQNCIFWRTAPGAHTFVARSTNFVNKRMTLAANRTYYIRIRTIPAPYTTPIAINEATKKDYDDFIAPWRTVKFLTFDDEWRKNFVTVNDGKWLNDVREYLKTIR